MLNLKPIKERLKAITSGTWSYYIDPAILFCFIQNDKYMRVASTENIGDAEFIVNAPADINSLINEVQHLRGILYAIADAWEYYDADCSRDFEGHDRLEKLVKEFRDLMQIKSKQEIIKNYGKPIDWGKYSEQKNDEEELDETTISAVEWEEIVRETIKEVRAKRKLKDG